MWKPNYASTAELAAFVRIPDNNDDAQLSLALATSSRAIDHATGRQFGRVDAPVARYFTATYDRLEFAWSVRIEDLMTDVGLVVAVDNREDTWPTTVTGARLGPRNAPAEGLPWSTLTFGGASAQPTGQSDGVRVTALWGWTKVPDPVKEACLLQASRLLSRRDSPYGVAGSPEAGSEIRLLARLDPDVAVALRPFRRFTWGAV